MEMSNAAMERGMLVLQLKARLNEIIARKDSEFSKTADFLSRLRPVLVLIRKFSQY